MVKIIGRKVYRQSNLIGDLRGVIAKNNRRKSRFRYVSHNDEVIDLSHCGSFREACRDLRSKLCSVNIA